MNKYKLKRIGKRGIALGLILLLLGTTACTKNTTYNDSQKPVTTITNDYIDTLKTNEFKVYDEDTETLQITLNNYNYMNFLNELANDDYTFRMAQYYGLDEALNLYYSTPVNKSTTSNLLDANGKLDASKLMQQITENNNAYMSQGKDAINTFYTDIKSADKAMICELIAKVVNSNFNDIEISKVANTLTKLTMFEKTGSASNAYITNNLTFVYNPTMTGMYADVQKIQGSASSEEETLEAVITHEIMHLLQYSANDIDDSNGIESGICRMYNVPNKDQKVPVDSLWNSWALEAAAELGMSDYLNIQPGTYAKKISYVRSYNLSRFNDLNLETQGLEDVTYNHTLEEAYKDLNLTTPEEQREFLNYMYSIEITQSDPDDFWENYTAKTGQTPSETEKTAIRMDIRTDAVKYLTRNFYQNLADSIYEGKVQDLDTVFYLVRNWELDTYGHLEYTKTASLEHADDFIRWHGDVQSQLFSAIAESNGKTPEEIESLYSEYNLQANVDNTIYDNCNLSQFNAYTSSYITDAKENYTTSNFSRNEVVLEYLDNIDSTSTKTETPEITK